LAILNGAISQFRNDAHRTVLMPFTTVFCTPALAHARCYYYDIAEHADASSHSNWLLDVQESWQHGCGKLNASCQFTFQTCMMHMHYTVLMPFSGLRLLPIQFQARLGG